MRKLITILLFLLAGITLQAQQLSSGDYTVSISKVTNSNISGVMIDNNFKGSQIEGTYTIKKKGLQIVSQKFTFLKLKDISITLNLEENERSGNTLEYDADTKKYELAGEEYRAKKNF